MSIGAIVLARNTMHVEIGGLFVLLPRLGGGEAIFVTTDPADTAQWNGRGQQRSAVEWALLNDGEKDD